MDHAEITSFVPTRLVARVTAEHAGRCDQWFQGVALFADISGFVKITEEFCRSGERGLERLSSLLDASFCRYIDLVDRYGGEVVYLAGDGLLAYWPCDAESMADVCAQAVACALSLCKISRTDETTRTANPNLHLGLAAGPLWAARVGGVDARWELLLGGRAMRRAAHAESLAGPGEVIVSTEIVDALRHRIRVLPKCEDFFRLQDGELVQRASVRSETESRIDATTIHTLVPRSVVEQAGGNRCWSAELRPVSALFARIDGLDEEQVDALERFQAVGQAIQDTIRRFSSSTGRLMIDDKGLVFHVVFGSPFNTHGDDTVRAAEAGLALEERLHAIGLRCCSGLAFGQVFCGVIGNGARREYVTIGRPMNIAARLMWASRGDLLCADGYPGLRNSNLELSSAASIRPKGVDANLQTYRVRRRALTTAPGVVFGRTDEQRILDERLEGLAQGKSGVVLVIGDPGLGKSRLVTELARRARDAKVAVGRGQADAAVGSTYQAWRGVFADIFEIDGQQTPEEARTKVRRRLSASSRLVPLSPLLNVVLPLAFEESEVTRHLSGQLRAEVTQRFLLDCLEDVAQTPMLVVLEDGHWMDSPSWRLADLAAKQLSNVLLVIALRPMPPRPELDALQQADADILRLLPLGAVEIRALVEQTLDGCRISEEVAEAVHRHTSGNPLFAQEYALLLRELGTIAIADGCFRFTKTSRDLSSLAVPSTVQATITSRLDHLDSIERLVLKAASVIGPSFDTELLEQVYPVDAERRHIARTLDSLCRRQLITKSESDPQRHQFHHVLIQEVAYKLMLHEQRTALHRSVARALEATTLSGQHYALLAHHWSMAEDRQKTRHFADLAAEHALATGAYTEAITLLERCLHDPSGVPKTRLVRFRRQLADAYAGLGKVSERDAAARTALETAVRPSRAQRGIVAAEAVLHVIEHGLERVLPLATVSRQPDSELELELSKVHRHRSDVCFYRSDALGLACELLAAIAHAQRYGPCADLVAAYAQFGGSLGIARFHAGARGLLKLASVVAEELDDPMAAAYAHMIRALYSVGVADWTQVEKSVAICQDICERLDDPVNWCNAEVIAFWAHHYRGHVEASGAFARRLLARAEEAGNAQQVAWGLRTLAVYELECGRFDGARASAEHAAELNSAVPHANEIVAAQGTLALARLRTGDIGSAQTAALSALEAGARVRRPTAHSTLAGWSGVLEVLLASMERERRDPYWRGVARRGLVALERHAHSFSVAQPTYRYFRGAYEAIAGNERAAIRDFRAGLDAAERLHIALEERRLTGALAAPLPAQR